MRSLPRALARTDPFAVSLFPWAAFTAVLLIDGWANDGPISVPWVLAASALYVLFVALPCMFPLSVARPGGMRWAVAAGMTPVAVASAMAMVSSSDAQAGLYVFFVAYVAVPLGAVIWAARSLVASHRG